MSITRQIEPRPGPFPRTRSLGRRTVAGLAAFLLAVSVLPALMASGPARAADGQGFTLNVSDLRFVLRQIKIAEQHAATRTAANPCGTLLGTGPDQIPNQNAQGAELPWGLRTVDGTCNNLKADQEDFGAAGRVFPRRTQAQFDAAGPHPGGTAFPPANGTPSTYANATGNVYDEQPRLASNLVVDQTPANPALRAAADLPAAPEALPPGVDPFGTVFIPNTAPDVGLSAPFNSLFTLFGQFFDHGLDLVDKSGGTVFVPLRADDPLIAGPNHVVGDADDLPASRRFMVLTRATTPGSQDAINKTSPFVDQSQTYTSHPSHQVFLRQYVLNAAGDPVATGRLLTGPGGGLATWADVKTQARTMLGIVLSDQDLLNLPLMATDPYGRFLPGANGNPQVTTGTGLVETSLTAPAALPANTLRTGIAFLDDIAHHAAPFGDNDTNPGNAPGARTADADTVISADDRSNATYDDELLGAHFVAGDGRINENIGLTAIHHVFHSEHNRLVGDVQNIITTQDPTQLAEWQVSPGVWNGERLFQAARFVTEMQYQHLAFEEFARKVQPMVNLFGGYDTSIDPAITAEFAHAVYRFGHSMLTETVARRTATGANRDIPLLDAFLNPPSFYGTGTPNPDAAVGDIARGMSDQVGNEIDEFVTEALRSNLLGLPLDLATLNMARARETGIPSLNEARRSFHALTNGNSALAPYANWIDFGLGLRHHESLINFVAAYGRHPSVLDAATMTAKRDAAALLVAADLANTATPADAVDFMNGTGTWADAGGRTTTGLDDVDLWLGGLAEVQAPFGGLLGSTFNFIFETQMEDLQDGDRFYYLTRTAGLNLLVQLEGNSFAELISRNSDAENLPADVFSRPDLTFVIDPATGNVIDDPATTENESTLAARDASNTLRYSGPLHVLWVGTTNVDRVRSSEGDDTLRGNEQNDRLEGGAGNDQFVGGSGQDVLTDSFGDDVLKGGDGHDAMSSGPGFDLNQGGLGNDFVVGGSDPTETFGGPGNDMVFAGDSTDTVFGDDGDDWLEGGGQNDLVQGDNGAPFADDPNTPGHDVLNGNGGQDDYDSEGGDDIMVSGPGIERNEGMLGFDWVTHKNDPQAADDDMAITGLLPPSVDALRDRFDAVEALSGGPLGDILRGDSVLAADAPGNELNAAGIARVDGLAALLPTGATSFNAGNIIIGGEGSDTIEGRGGDDIIHGDSWLNVQLQAPGQAAVDNMAAYRAAVFAGTINPGDIQIVRSVVTTAPGTFQDTAVFSGPQAEYDVTANTDGSVTVAHVRGNGQDGTDTLFGIERRVFADTAGATAPTAPLNVTGVAGNGQVTVNFTAPVSDGGSPITEYEIDVRVNGVVTRTVLDIAANLRSVPVTGLTNGTAYTFVVRAFNAVGEADSAPSAAVTPQAPNVAPTVTARVPAVNATGVAVANDITATFSEAVQGVNTTTFAIRPTSAPGSAPIAGTVTRNGTTDQWILNPTANLAANTSYTVTLTGGAAAIRDLANAPLVTTTWSFTTAAAVNPAPTVTTRVPAVNATGVAVGNSITATFSEAVQGVNTTTFAIRPTSAPGSAPIVGTVSQNVNTWTLDPTANLAANTSYTVTLTGGATAIRDLANAPLVTTTWSFTTAAAVVNQPPTLTARAPAVNQTGVAVNGNVTATFNEPVTGVSGATFVLRNAAGATIAAVVSQNGTTNQWTLNPNASLVGNTSYTVTLTGSTTAIRDLANLPFATTTWSFTTSAPAVPGAPPTPTAVSGVAGGAITATVNWVPPTNTGGSAITGYQVRVQRMNGTTVVTTVNSSVVGAASRQMIVGLPVAGASYRFAVRAINAVGQGPFSANSNTVIGR